MKPLLALAALLMAAATLFYVTARHHRREYPMERYAEGDDGVQPVDPYPWDLPLHVPADGRWLLPGEVITVATNSPAWERGEVGWQRPWATGLG